jgi:hypothetical protein
MVVCAFLIAVARLSTISIIDAHAKWNPLHSDAPKSIQHWYSTQQTPDGGFCCDRADGHDFYGDYAVDANGNVKFDADGKHYMIPKGKVLTGPNPTGHAVWWWANSVHPEDGKITYCFALGPEG